MREREQIDDPADALGLRLLRWALDRATQVEESLYELYEGPVPLQKGEELYRLELIIFCLFPVDAVVQKQFGSEAPEVRRAMRDRLEKTVRERPELPDPTEVASDGLDDLISCRFREYNAEYGLDRPFSSDDEGVRRLRHLTWLAYKRLTGFADVDPGAAQMLSVSFVMTMKHLPEPLSTARDSYLEWTRQ